MAQFVRKNNFFEFNNDVFQQISVRAIGTKFTLPYACIFMDQIGTKFLKLQAIKLWCGKDKLTIFFY